MLRLHGARIGTSGRASNQPGHRREQINGDRVDDLVTFPPYRLGLACQPVRIYARLTSTFRTESVDERSMSCERAALPPVRSGPVLAVGSDGRVFRPS